MRSGFDLDAGHALAAILVAVKDFLGLGDLALLVPHGCINAALRQQPLMGAAFGIIAGVVQHAMSGSKRDFASVKGLQAARYGVQVTNEHAAEAVRLMGQAR